MKQPEALKNLAHVGDLRAVFGERGMILAGIALDAIQDAVTEETLATAYDYDWCDDLGGVDMPPPLNALSYAWEVHACAEEQLR